MNLEAELVEAQWIIRRQSERIANLEMQLAGSIKNVVSQIAPNKDDAHRVDL